MRTIDWVRDHAVIVDQTRLPHDVVVLEVRDADTMIDAIRRLAVRGAPAIGVAGAFGVALAARAGLAAGRDVGWLRAEAARVAAARPTAVNLTWAVTRVLTRLGGVGDTRPGDRMPIDGAMVEAITREATEIMEDDVVNNRRLAARGADLLAELVPAPLRVHTHCNAGGLACVEWGTALGVVRALHERGVLTSVTADETRPLLQGARLTAFELAAMGIDHQLVVDGAGPSVIARGLTDAVVVGADRIAANGDVANKIGTYPLALAAARAGVPFVVAAPESTIDRATATGADIEIEVRDPEEILGPPGARCAPSATEALNLAFDVTPADLVTAIVTESRVIRPSIGERP